MDFAVLCRSGFGHSRDWGRARFFVPSWAILGQSWGHVGAILGHLTTSNHPSGYSTLITLPQAWPPRPFPFLHMYSVLTLSECQEIVATTLSWDGLAMICNILRLAS